MNTEKHPPNSLHTSLANHLIFAAFFLTLIGLLSIYTASALKSVGLYGHPYHFLHKQAFGALLGFLGVYSFQSIPIKWLERLTLPFLFVSTITLMLIFVPNIYTKISGASRWLRVGSFSLQPAEFIKIALIFFLAKNLARPGFNINNVKSSLLPNLSVLSLFSLCLMMQPDFGSTALITLITFLMLFVAGLPKKQIFHILFITSSLFTYAIISKPYRLKRLASFFDPWSHSTSGGFQIIQSYLAFKNGGFVGVGIGLSKQKLFFLPEAHTDFILSVLAEEMGLLGIFLVFGFYLYIILLGYKIALSQKTNYRKYLAFGIISLISIQTCFNIGVVTGALPTKGIPLPFMSSGVSSLLSSLFCIAVLARLEKEKTSL